MDHQESKRITPGYWLYWMGRTLKWLLLILTPACAPTQPSWSAPPSLNTPYPPLTPAAIRACPVTFPNGWNHPPALVDVLPNDQGERPSLSASEHGNGFLWIPGFPTGGKIAVHSEHWDPDGSLRWKMGWWLGVPGRLHITGRRLDAPAPPLEADIPEGYGGIGFQAAGLHFPSEGCWEVIGRVVSPNREASLRVVLLAVRLPFYPLEPKDWSRLRKFQPKDVDLRDLPHAIRYVFAPVLQHTMRVPWGLQGVWSEPMKWLESPLFSWEYGELILETAHRSWSSGPPNPTGSTQRLVTRGKPARCIQSSQEDAAALIWEEGAFRYRILQWGLKLSCADLRRIVEGPSTPASGEER